MSATADGELRKDLDGAVTKPKSLPIARFINRAQQLPVNLVLGGIGVVAIALLVTVGTALFRLDPYTQDLSHLLLPPSFQGPGLKGIMGTDILGRDVFSRVVVGGRYSLVISIVSTVLTAIIGTSLGLMSGYSEGWLGAAIMRLADVQVALPYILLTIGILTLLPPTLPNIILALAVTRWVVYARTGRAYVLSIKHSGYVLAARALGTSEPRILWRYILPNMVGPMVAIAGVQLAVMVIMESTLSYLGLGVQPPEPSWGTMIRQGQPYLNSAWWIAVFPVALLMVFVLSLNLFADGVRSLRTKVKRL